MQNNDNLEMKRYIGILFVLFLSTYLNAQIIGTTKGEFSVNQGVAKYTFKVDLPPGVAGMDPQLSLDYSSENRQNGFMGIGWSIGGVPAITRCPQSRVIDGANHQFGVNLDRNDRFCMEGQRLINVSGSYGSNGTEYKTEIDTYMKVISKGDFNGGPAYFKVKTKSGLTYIYGKYNDSANKGNSGDPYIDWKLSKIIDTYRNEINFLYKKDIGRDKGDHYLERVTYADVTIEYLYKERNDLRAEFPVNRLLKEIVISMKSTDTSEEVRRYTLEYVQQLSGLKASQLKSIQEHVQEDSLEKIVFSYSDEGTLSFASSPQAWLSEYGESNMTATQEDTYRSMADMNGDGLLDATVFSKKGFWVALNNGKGFDDLILWTNDFGYENGWASMKIHPRRLADVNGDGLLDIVGFHNYGVQVALNTGENSFEASTMWIQGFGLVDTMWLGARGTFKDITWYENRRELVDLNGDGLVDILAFNKEYGGVHVALNTGTSFVKKNLAGFVNWAPGVGRNLVNFSRHTFIVDINNDKLTDIVFLFGDEVWVSINPYGPGFYSVERWVETRYGPWHRLGDVNGDGLLDLIAFTSEGVKVALNHKTRFRSDGIWSKDTSFTAEPKTRLKDMNGDGLADLVNFSKNGVYVALSNGKGFESRSLWSGAFANKQDGWDDANKQPRFINDINGDGSKDLIGFHPDGIFVALNKKQSSRLERITNYKDQDIKINYKFMTDRDEGVYHSYLRQGARNAFAWNSVANNNVEVLSPIPLVSKVQSANGIGGYNTLRYAYYGHIYNTLRGAQGFHSIETFDDTTQMRSRVYYKQIEAPDGEGFAHTGTPYYSYSGKRYGDTSDSFLSETYVSLSDSVVHRGVDTMQTEIHQPFTFKNKTIHYDPDSKQPISEVYKYNCIDTEVHHGESVCVDAPRPPEMEQGVGNILLSVDRTHDVVHQTEHTKTIYNYYNSSASTTEGWRWIVGRLSASKVVHQQSDTPDSIKASSFSYNTLGVLTQEVANAGTTVALTKSYTYDRYGNKRSERISGNGIIPATTTFVYGANGKFLEKVINSIGLEERRVYDERFGTPTSLTGPNGLTTRWRYDGLGRKVWEKRADGTETTWQHNWDDGASIGVPHALYRVTVQGTGVPEHATYYDKYAREVGSYTYGMQHQRLIKRKAYNAKGELVQETLPYYEGQKAGVIQRYYDTYGRVYKVTKPGPLESHTQGNTLQVYTTRYENHTHYETDPNGNTKRVINSAIGKVVSVTDAYNTANASSIVYTYDATGNLRTTTDNAGNVIEMRYDVAGNKYYMDDPDMGEWHYRYNARGQLIQQWSGTQGRDRSRHATNHVYDILGRLFYKTTYDRYAYKYIDDDDYSEQTTYYRYGGKTAPLGSRGKVIRVSSRSTRDGSDYRHQSVSTKYDTLGRVQSTNTYIRGRGNYHSSTSYFASGENLGKVKSITYPNGYSVTYGYEQSSGILNRVTGSDGKVHYQINHRNAFGQVTEATFANGIKTVYGYDSAGFMTDISSRTLVPRTNNIQAFTYRYDGLGNVKQRIDSSVVHNGIQHKITDTYTYDSMNRLVHQKLKTRLRGHYAEHKAYRYDAIGNITYVDAYEYDDGDKERVAGEVYGAYLYESDKPHAVTSVGSRSYAYDEIGNMVNRDGDTIVYNMLNKPAILTNGKNGKEVRFYYGVGGKRYLKVTSDKEIYYIGKGYEEEIEDYSTKEVCYIMVGDKTIGTHTEVKNTYYAPTHEKYDEAVYTRYFHTDALGSITAITDENAEVVERRSYDAFGKIRALDYGLQNNKIIPSNSVIQSARAYTGHEQIAELSGLIHMNGRVYDSEIGRFLSADIILQAPHDTQSYNRYSYVRNNPLIYTDPSGHIWGWFKKLWKKIKKHIRTIVAIVVAAVIAFYLPGMLLSPGNIFTTMATGSGALTLNAVGVMTVGAVAGFASGAIMTGSLKGGLEGAMWGAISAGTAFGIGEALGHAGGIFTKGVSQGKAFVKAAAHGLSRGVISVARGGTFKAGFASGFGGSFFSPGTTMGGRGVGGFSLRTTIAAIVGGTASKIGGGKFSSGAVTGAFAHMFNDEGGIFSKIWNGLGKSMTKLNDRKYEILSDIGKGFKGGLKGYRQVRDNSPWYAQGMLKVSMTTVELGLTAPLEVLSPVSIYVHSVSGTYLDTIPYLNPVSTLNSTAVDVSGYDNRWFK